jgi:hypothetical protein
LQVVTELKNRGVQDLYLACVDGLKGLSQAIETVFPKAQVQIPTDGDSGSELAPRCSYASRTW